MTKQWSLMRKTGPTIGEKAELQELEQIDEYETFKESGSTIPNDYKKIKVHFVYDVKHDGRHKARLVAGGHLTDTPVDSVYSSVVSLRGLRLTLFLAELNQLETWCTDVGNAYLEAYTEEKVYIVLMTLFKFRSAPRIGHLQRVRRVVGYLSKM